MLSLIPSLAPWPVSRTPIVVADGTRWRHFSFLTNEPIDDVKEEFASAAGAITTANGRYSTTAASQYLQLSEFLFGPEDFTIQLKFRLTTLLSNIASFVGAIGSVTPTSDTLGFWSVYWNTDNKLTFLFRDTPTTFKTLQVACLASAFPINTDHHLEVGRKNGIAYIFLNGGLLVSGPLSGKNSVQTATMRKLTMQQTSAVFPGARWDMRINKEECLHTAGFLPPTTVPAYNRPIYSDADAATIRAQVDFRRDSSINVANNRFVYVTGSEANQVLRGRMNVAGTAAAANSYTIPLEPWGAADFTVECSVNFTSVGVTAGGLLLGHWWLGSATNDKNRWAIAINQSRQPLFGMNNSAVGTDGTYAQSTFVMTAGLSYKIIVERILGTISMYVLDGLTGELLNTTTVTNSNPIRGAAPQYAANYSPGTTNYSMTAQIWDIRIADKAMYGGVPKLLPCFPAMPDSKYTAAEEADIVSQLTLRRSPRDEVTGGLITPLGGSVVNGSVSVPGDANYRGYSYPKPAYFGAADFTLECRLTITGASTDPIYMWGQCGSGGATNSWSLRVVAGKLRMVFSKTGAAGGTEGTAIITLSALANWVADVEYYIVAERVAGVTTLYIDGVQQAQSALVNFALINSTLDVTRGDGAGCGYAAINIRDMRISKTSQYKGVVPKVPKYKSFRAQKPSITTGFKSGGTGTIYGYFENCNYSTADISLGSCTHKLFRDARTSTVIVKRLKALFLDRGSFLILGWEDTTLTPTADMPAWTNTLVVNGVTFANLNSAPVSGFASPLGGTSCYWSGGATPFNPLVEGREIAFEFI